MRVALESVLSTGCVALLGAWLVLTIINQLNLRWMRHIKALDFMLLIPRWTFFAPDPGLSDFHLSYRTIAADGTPSAWEEIDLIARRTALSAIWNPDKRVTKAVIEVVAFLVPLCSRHPEMVPGSPPYRCVRNHARRAAERSGRGHPLCEFRLTETGRLRDARSFFYRSAPVRLGAEYVEL